MTTLAAEKRPRVLSRVMIATRDGAELCTDIYLPDTEEARPTIVVRTPYGRQVPFLLLLAQRLNAAGFAVALQDSRGRYQSSGTFDWRREHLDGHDTLAWLAQQEWADGSVGQIGISISGCSNFLLAATPPPAGIRLRALVSIVAIVDYYSLFYRDGALVQHWAQPVSMMMGDARLATQPIRWSELFKHLPLGELPGRAGGDPLWRRVLDHPAPDAFWDEVDATHALADVSVPVLHLSGWYDFILLHTLRAYEALAPTRDRHGAPQQLVVGPWDHQTIFSSFTARSAPGGSPQHGSMNLMDYAIEWFIRWCADRPTQPGGVRLYIMGQDEWIEAETFPVPETQVEDWYLDSDGHANTSCGDGRLVSALPERSVQDEFTYDPDNPAPTIGGATWFFPPAKLAAGAFDQTAVEQRPDVLVYTSAPLTEDLVIAGRVDVELWASTSAPQTDFTAKLVDVGLDGVPRIVQDGILRVRPERADDSRAARTPASYRIDLQATAYAFKAGHRIRLEVSSSNFPKFNRNLNVAGPLHLATSGVPARQVVGHGGATPSCLRLPVLPRHVVDRRKLGGQVTDKETRA